MANRERLLEMALKGLEADRAKLDEEIAEIKRELKPVAVASQGARSGSTTSTPLTKKRTMSAAAKRRISEGMKRRYATLRELQQPLKVEATEAGGLTAAGRNKLSQMMKARWAAKKKATKAAKR